MWLTTLSLYLQHKDRYEIRFTNVLRYDNKGNEMHGKTDIIEK